MSQGPERLNPRKLISLVSTILDSDEVLLRRVVSALYFSLFNYWALKHYSKRNRGKGPLRDYFSLTEFTGFLYRNGLDREVYTLLVYRVGADHYALNPTEVVITDRQFKGKSVKVDINENSIKIVLKAAEQVLHFLEKY